jgi:hypothetical protein
VASTVSMMINISRIALRAGGGDGVDEPSEGVGCIYVSNSTTNPATAGSAVVMAASATGIGMEYLTMAYRV